MIDVKQLLNDIANYEYYEVRFELDECVQWNGQVPFDLKINDGLAVATVLAGSYEQAVMQVVKHFNLDGV